MYQSECAPKNIRGLIVGLYQLAITIGALLAAIVLNATKDFPNHSAWRASLKPCTRGVFQTDRRGGQIPIGIQFAWAFVLGGGMILLPESPRYLMYKGRVDSARKSLARLTNSPADSAAVDAECHEIELAIKSEQNLGTVSYLGKRRLCVVFKTLNTKIDCFRNGEYKNGLRTWTGMLLQGWQQLTGINFVFYYGVRHTRHTQDMNLTISIDNVLPERWNQECFHHHVRPLYDLSSIFVELKHNSGSSPTS